MIKTAGRATPILNYICVVLLFAIFAMQLLPFWTNADNVETSPTNSLRVISIQGYTWFPENKKTPDTPGNDMSKYFDAKYTTYDCNKCAFKTQEAMRDCPECGGKSTVKKNEWKIGDIVLLPVMIVICCIITIFFGIKKPTRLWMNIVYLLAGVLGLVTYLTEPIYQLNQMYIVHVLLCDHLILASLANITCRPWKRIVHYMKTGD